MLARCRRFKPQVQADEFAKWIKRGRPEDNAQPVYGKLGGESELTSTSQLAAMSAVIEATPTSEIRRELEETAVSMPTDEELVGLSRSFNGWLEALLKRRMLPSYSYYALFKAIDDDGSGFITYDELYAPSLATVCDDGGEMRVLMCVCMCCRSQSEGGAQGDGCDI